MKWTKVTILEASFKGKSHFEEIFQKFKMFDKIDFSWRSAKLRAKKNCLIASSF
jgi:hypothetical protein